MQDQHDSDFLTWTLAAAAVLIMTVAVRINAGEPATPGPAVHDPGEHDRYPLRYPARNPPGDLRQAAHSTASAAARV